MPGFPTGTVYNGTADFKLPNGSSSVFLFASEDGTISAWTPGAASAQIVISRAPSVYKGLAIASVYGKNFLFATDFHAGRIDVFDSTFQLIATQEESFRLDLQSAGGSDEDRRLFASIVPFNVQNIGGNLYITFAKQDAQKHDEVDGAGLGLVAAYAHGQTA